MIYFLDTNAAIGFINHRPAIIRERFREARRANGEFFVSTVVLFELWFGVANSGRWQENAASLRSFLSGNVVTVPFDDEDARAAAELRDSLHRNGTPIGPYDVLIAAQALRRNATLVTSNISEFGLVAGLTCEDWSLPE